MKDKINCENEGYHHSYRIKTKHKKTNSKRIEEVKRRRCKNEQREKNPELQIDLLYRGGERITSV